MVLYTPILLQTMDRHSHIHLTGILGWMVLYTPVLLQIMDRHSPSHLTGIVNRITCSHSIYYTCDICRSIGVANFNVHHLKELKKARPDHIPAGETITKLMSRSSDNLMHDSNH